MIRGMVAAAVMWCGLAGTAAADAPVIVELYTSQGCSSCPPADAMLQELSERDDVIALALHVDYWDYIGWKDSFAHPGHTDRQRGYARAAGESTIYTPQFVVGGVDHIVGTQPADLEQQIEAHLAAPDAVEMALVRDGGAVRLTGAAGDLAGPVDLHMLRYTPAQRVAIRKGENRGRVMDYSNIVSDWQVIGQWDPREALDLRVDAAGELPVVVIAQRPDHGPILGAVRLR
ncbi:DUF1223 domain-containing protein [Aestuariibius insulae]|uniref:DUF1223 domain-containing protein n=1 Tax=Aestuariibius insulae TaxID=2058287 RepID=UPI00345EF093